MPTRNAVLLPLVALLLTFLASAMASAAELRPEPPPVELGTVGRGAAGAPLFGRALILRDDGRRMSLADALAADDWRRFEPSDLNLGITDARVWLALRLVNDTLDQRRVVVGIDIANLSQFTVYASRGEDFVEIAHIRSDMPVDERPLEHSGPAAPVDLAAGETRDVIVTFANDFAIPLSAEVRLWSAHGFERHMITEVAFFAFWVAALLMTGTFWLLYGIVMRQWRLLFYALYAGFAAFTYSSFFGIGSQLLMPHSSFLQTLGFHWSMFLMAACALEFARRHLEVARLRPTHDVVIRIGAFVCVALGLLAILVPQPAIEAPLTFLALSITPWYITFLSWRTYRRDGLGYAKWMVIGWLAIALTGTYGIFGSLFDSPLLPWAQAVFIRTSFALLVLESLVLSLSLAQWLRGLDTRRLAAETAAAQDPLTGLLNRRGFDDSMSMLTDGGPWPKNLWLAAIDIDRFKLINDLFSHAAGDAVLVRLARLLTQRRQLDDVAARFGGEEFLLLFSAHSPDDAFRRIDRLRQTFAAVPTAFGRSVIDHSFSAGLIRAGDDPYASPATLLMRADEALYAAKRAGRNRVLVGGMELPAVAKAG